MRYSGLRYPLQKIHNDLYEVIAEYPINRIKDTNPIKDWLGCDSVFKVNSKGSYIFCRLIEEAKIINE